MRITAELVDVAMRTLEPRGRDPRRSAEIILRSMMGETLESIGARFGITRERTRQIVAAYEQRAGRSVRGIFAEEVLPPAIGKPDAADRFFDKIEWDPATDCWNWTGFVMPSGYGSFSAAGEVYAHRYSHLLFKGRVPEGLHTDHLCRNRRCVNPDHLEMVTARENFERSPHWQDGAWVHSRRRGADNPKFSRICRRGHLKEGDNLYIYVFPDGREMRQCRACQAAGAKERYARRKHSSSKAA